MASIKRVDGNDVGGKSEMKFSGMTTYANDINLCEHPLLVPIVNPSITPSDSLLKGEETKHRLKTCQISIRHQRSLLYLGPNNFFICTRKEPVRSVDQDSRLSAKACNGPYENFPAWLYLVRDFGTVTR